MNIGKFQIQASRIVLLGIGVSLGFFSIILGSGGYDFILEFSVSQAVRLVRDTPVWHMWQGLPMPIYANVYLFNVSNAVRLSQGAKPRVKELGPYVYSVDYEKFEISVSADENTIEYRQNRTYIFEPDLSNGKETDVVNLINVVYVAVSHLAHTSSIFDAEALEKLDKMLDEAGESVIKTVTVREFLFEGISVKPFIDVLKDPAFANFDKIKLPSQMQDGSFAMFKGKNNTDNGKWVVKSGIIKPKDFGRVVSINGKSKFPYWKAPSCNSLNGTDGMNFEPFISPGITKINSVSMDLCRSLKWVYAGEESSSWGIPVSRYRLQRFASVIEDPNTWCFCVYEDILKCNLTGIGSAAPCFGGLPLTYSKPHFYAVDPTIAKGVEGVAPKKKKHESYVDLNALTGAPIDSFFRVQYSIDVMNWSDMPSFANLNRALVPVVWIEQTATLDFINKVLILSMEFSRKYIFVVRWLLIASFWALLIAGVFLIFRDRATEMKAKNVIGGKNFVTKELGTVGIKT